MTTRRQMMGSALTAAAIGASMSTTAALAQSAPGESTFDRVRRTKKLRIGAVPGAAPYYIKDIATGAWSGFYIDLPKALAAELEAELVITETTWGNAVLDLQSDKIDLFFGLNPTPKRALVIDFSVPIFNNAFTMLTKKDFKPKSWAELNDPAVKIAVDVGSSHDQVVTRLCPKAEITRLKTTDEAIIALQSGRVDAQCLVLMLSMTALKKNPSIGQLLIPTPVFATTSNAGFRREPDKTWRDFVNTWIEFNKGLGLVRSVIVNNMATVGLSEADLPPGIQL